MKLIYLAAPFSPQGAETEASNLYRAKNIYETLSEQHKDCCFLAHWILNCEIFKDTPENRVLGMRRNFAVIERCDELWLCGPRVSSGMVQEMNYAKRNGKPVINLVKSEGES